MGKGNHKKNRKNSINPNKKSRKLNSKKDNLTKLQNCSQGQRNLQFTALDTWFFRESRPHDAAGASELSSLFPPPVRTLAGAVRFFLGESIDVDWKAFAQGDGKSHSLEDFDFKTAIGDSDSLGQLSLQGAWVCKNGQRLYPAPFYLMHQEQDLTRLEVGGMVNCDLGKVRLPELPEGKVGYKNYEQAWVTAEGWRKLLNDETPAITDIFNKDQLFTTEPRLGIARDNASRSVIEGQLYQTQHLRLAEDVSIELDVMGIADELLNKLPEAGNKILRLGGEGRMAALTVKSDYPPLPSIDDEEKPLQKFIIHFITAADFDGQMFPECFSQETNASGDNVWRGIFEGVELDIVSAVIGKVHREGGWDMQKHQPRAVKSYIPAGSAWFCQVTDKAITAKKIIEVLGQCLGNEKDLGRGQILIGQWNDNHKGAKNGNS
ncbi:MAG: hypothetical protein GQ569_11855 [Methylococcaceae bacterium]|nr:hypothetical protein [Methylococcaceae bacterium]